MRGSPREQQITARFADAFECGDVAAIVALLTDDAWLTMPPLPLEYQGRDMIGDFLDTVSFRH
jgi:RNA polymerase sigma-70 factor (ECF subfamily)